ncbi:MAG: hypothetical protein IPN76_35290 [Saprospiraceae bacterium]|nr:hypothetical protein [Saprospiraceae bacterium]
MQQLVLKIRESHYQLFLKFLSTLEYVKIVQPSTATQPPSPNRYDFSDLAGKLEWKGDAVAQQRLMRDEW